MMIGVAAVNKLGYVGLNGGLPWKCKADMQFFKKLTMGGTVVMGRKTWDSIGKKDLPGRRNLVLTGNNVANIIDMAELENPVFALGGMKTWEVLSPWISSFYISRIKDETVGDLKFFEDFDHRYNKVVSHDMGEFDLEIWVKRGIHNIKNEIAEAEKKANAEKA